MLFAFLTGLEVSIIEPTSQPKQYIIITTTFDNKDELDKVSKILLEDRLVSCCQVYNIESSYWWKDNIVDANEYLLKMKTKKELYKEVERIILENHSYEVPEIITYNIEDGYSKYLNWIDKETTK